MISHVLFQNALSALENTHQDTFLACLNQAPLWEWWVKVIQTKNHVLRDALRSAKGLSPTLRTAYNESLLVYAIMNEDVEMATYLLEAGLSPDETDAKDCPLLSLACGRYSNLDMAKLLLDKVSLIPQGPKDSVLGHAAYAGNADLVEVLLAPPYSLNPNEYREDKYRGREYVWGFARNTNVLEVFQKYGADFHLDPSLLWERSMLEGPKMREYLLAQGFSIESETRNLLHLACAENNLETVQWLLEHGADPNYLSGCDIRDTWTFPPLYALLCMYRRAVYDEKCFEIAKMLLAYGADASLIFGQTQQSTPESLFWYWLVHLSPKWSQRDKQIGSAEQIDLTCLKNIANLLLESNKEVILAQCANFPLDALSPLLRASVLSLSEKTAESAAVHQLKKQFLEWLLETMALSKDSFSPYKVSEGFRLAIRYQNWELFEHTLQWGISATSRIHTNASGFSFYSTTPILYCIQTYSEDVSVDFPLKVLERFFEMGADPCCLDGQESLALFIQEFDLNSDGSAKQTSHASGPVIYNLFKAQIEKRQLRNALSLSSRTTLEKRI